MNKIKEGEFRLVSLDKYDPELEEIVAAHLRDSDILPVNTRLYKREEDPDFEEMSPKDISLYKKREINKIINGDGDAMCGKMYFWFRYCKIKNIKGGAIIPEYRVADNEWFKLIEECQESEEWGVVCVKRRRVGASWKEACDVIHDCITKPYFHIGLNSKSERDSEHLFAKIMFIYERLPEFLRIKIGRRNGMHVEFFRKFKEEDGTMTRRGLQSELTVVPPTDSAYEGLMLSKWVCDEAGKIPNLPQMWSFTEDCLMQEYTRAGIPILFGTSGDISTTGGGLMHMWDNSEVYKLKRFFFAGWMGIAVDEYGNDRKEEVIRWIIYKRKEEEKKGVKAYNDFLQRYPLNLDEAFSQSGGGLGDIAKLNAQKAFLRSTPPILSKGMFKTSLETGDIKFIPSKFGEVIIHEHPQDGGEYVIGCDPADHDDAGQQASELSIHVMRLPQGIEPPKLVCEYTCRPQKVRDYFEQAAKIAEYYNNTKILVENNRYGMIQYFKENNLVNLLEWRPVSVNTIVRRRASEIGLRMTEDLKIYMETAISDYIDDYCDCIPFMELINEILDYKKRNTDRVISFGLCLIMLKAKYKRNFNKESKDRRRPPSVSYKLINGRMQRVEKRETTSKTKTVWQ